MNPTHSPKTNVNIECPVFKTNESLSACYNKYDTVMRGGRLQARRGCQVLINCGTCPIWALKREMGYKKSVQYFSDEIKEQVIRTLVPLRLLEIYDVEEEDREQIQKICGVYKGKEIARAPKPRGRPKKSL